MKISCGSYSIQRFKTPSRKESGNKLKHEKDDLTFDQLMQCSHIEEETRNHDNWQEATKEFIMEVHIIEDKLE